MISGLAEKFWMKIGKPEKVYPVKVEKHKRRGEENWVKQMDRGRTVVEDKGKVFELMNEPHVNTKVPYSAFNNTADGSDEVTVLMPERDTVVPAETQIDPENEKIETVVDTTAWETWAEQEFQDSAKIVETEEEKWWENRNVQAMMIFFGAGLFFVFLGVGYSYVINEAVMQELEKLRGSVDAAASGAAASLLLMKMKNLR